MNPDFAIILNFKLKNNNELVADKVVKAARNIGVRAISGDNYLQDACQKYSIAFVDEQDADKSITSENVIDKLVQNRKNNLSTVIAIQVDENGDFSESDKQLFKTINDWMHMFGHAFNESSSSALTVNADGFVLENRHANYQKYIYVKSPLPEKIEVSGLTQQPNRIEWIEDRQELKFTFTDNILTIDLTGLENNFPWQIIRIQAHRPEDDLAETKY